MDTSYDVSSRYYASDQWMQACISEGCTYEEYCTSARNNDKDVLPAHKFNDAVEWYEEQANMYGSIGN